MKQEEIDDQVFELYDEYCHGNIDRREFFKRAGQLTWNRMVGFFREHLS